MGLSVIATNYSGPTAYLSDANSFPLAIDGVDEAGFAQPNLKHLIKLLRQVESDRSDMLAKGRQAASDMRTLYNKDVVGRHMQSRLAGLAEAHGLS